MVFTLTEPIKTGLENTKRYTKVSRNKNPSPSPPSETISEGGYGLFFDELHLLCSVLCSQDLFWYKDNH